jgi:hypothetical protein
MKPIFRGSLVWAALMLGIAGAANGATLYSSPLLITGPFDVECLITNVGSKTDVEGVINIYMTNGDLVATRDVTLSPFETRGLFFLNSGNNRAYVCEFILAAPRSAIRGTACRVDPAKDEGCLDSLPAR